MKSVGEDNLDEAFASTGLRHPEGQPPGGGHDLPGGHTGGTGGGSGHSSTALSHATLFDEQITLGNASSAT